MYRKTINIVIIIIVIALSSCGSIRLSDKGRGSGDFEVNSERLLGRVRTNNILETPLAINKITVTYMEGGERRRLRANLKYNGVDSMLISIRTFAGIEAARVLIAKDTVQISDKINKILYKGLTEQISNKYGINFDFIELIFGDINEIDVKSKRIKCENGITKIYKTETEKNIEYTIDCNINKLIEVVGNLGEENEIVRGRFDSFREENGLLYPGSINWKMEEKEIEIQLELQNLKKSGKTYIVFRTGRGYKEKILR